MARLPFTSLVIMVLWDWSLSFWQLELKSMLKIRCGQLRFVLTCLLQSGRTPLHHACSGGHAEVVTVLLAAGAQIDAQDQVWTVEMRFVLTCLLQSGRTPLHHACSEGHVEVVTVLLSAGAPIEAQTKVRSE
jgi:ankyrin repeat protein